jgi:hypothetical protein
LLVSQVCWVKIDERTRAEPIVAVGRARLCSGETDAGEGNGRWWRCGAWLPRGCH